MNPTTHALGLALVHFLWQGTVVALALALVLRPLRTAAASTRYGAACLALGLMAALPPMTAAALHMRTTAPRVPTTTWEGGALRAPAASVAWPESVATPEAIRRTTQPAAPSVFPVSTPDVPVLPWVLSGWLAGVIALTLRHVGGLAYTRRLRTRGVRPLGPATARVWERLVRRMGIDSDVLAFESAIARVPLVVGWLKPVILVPIAAVGGLSPAQLEAVLAHELAHIRRRDHLVNAAQIVVETLLFYHPAVWWVSGRIRLEREHCCDDVAVEVCGDPCQYAAALAELEASRAHGRVALAASGSGLLRRVQRLLDPGRKEAAGTPRWSWAGTAVLLLVAAGMSTALGSTGERLVRNPSLSALGPVSVMAGAPDRLERDDGHGRSPAFAHLADLGDMLATWLHWTLGVQPDVPTPPAQPVPPPAPPIPPPPAPAPPDRPGEPDAAETTPPPPPSWLEDPDLDDLDLDLDLDIPLDLPELPLPPELDLDAIDRALEHLPEHLARAGEQIGEAATRAFEEARRELERHGPEIAARALEEAHRALERDLPDLLERLPPLLEQHGFDRERLEQELDQARRRLEEHREEIRERLRESLSRHREALGRLESRRREMDAARELARRQRERRAAADGRSSGFLSIWTDDGTRFEVRARGDIRPTEDDTALAHLGPDASLDIDVTGGGERRHMEARSGADGAIEQRFFIDGRSAPFDDIARAWLASVLPRVVRQTTIGAEGRVDRLLAGGGPVAVLDEISRIPGGFVKHRYFDLLLDRASLDGPTLSRALEQAARELESDHHLATLLVRVSGAGLIGPDTRGAYLSAAGAIEAPFHRRRVLIAILEAGSVDRDLAQRVASAASSLTAASHRASVLEQLVRVLPESIALDETREAFRGLESGHHQRRVLGAALAGPDPTDDLLLAVISLATQIESDSHAADVLLTLIDRHGAREGLRPALERALDGIDSAHHRRRVSAALDGAVPVR